MQEHQIEFELTKEFRDRFQEALDARDAAFIRASLEGVKAADITSLLYEFNSEESKYVMDLLSIELQAEIINDLDSDTRRNYLKVYEPAELAAFLNHLDSDDVADILHELAVKLREQVLSALEPVLRSQVTELLRYEENVAGGLMAKELMKARVHWTVVQCIDEIRKQAENVSKFYTVYVVDDQDVLMGRVDLQDLIISDARTVVGDICERDILTVQTFQEDWEVAEMMRKYDMESVPVVNVRGKLVGRITIDDVVDVITEQAEEERQAMTGISEDVVLFGEYSLSLIVSCALLSVIVFASFVGTVTPLILNRYGFNPALAAGPFITTINDLLGLTVYFFTIHLFLQ